jgi:hypothetical protein
MSNTNIKPGDIVIVIPKDFKSYRARVEKVEEGIVHFDIANIIEELNDHSAPIAHVVALDDEEKLKLTVSQFLKEAPEEQIVQLIATGFYLGLLNSTSSYYVQTAKDIVEEEAEEKPEAQRRSEFYND